MTESDATETKRTGTGMGMGHDERPAPPRDVVEGLVGRPRTLSSKWLYDAHGSRLFDAITELPEYYVTRVERSILDAHIGEMAAAVGPGAAVLEYGSGSSTKTTLLLDALEAPTAYVPIDISEEHLHRSAERLRERYSEFDIVPVAADYTRPVPVPELPPATRRRVVFFPGSTIGNFERDAAVSFVQRMAMLAGDSGAVLLGRDLVQPVDVLLAAYDDAQGVTAAFNLNGLRHLCRRFDVALELDAFAHEARWNEELSCIEMHLVASRPTTLHVGDDRIELAAGESIRTERSHKYTLDGFAEMVAEAGLRVERVWTDDRQWFGVHLLIPR